MDLHPLLESALPKLLSHSREYALIVLDAAGRIVQWLGASQQLMGFSAEEMIGRHAGEIFISPDREKGFDELEMAIARESGRCEDDRWHVRKDGARIWVSGSMEAVREESGAVVGYVKVMRDRTDLRIHVDRLESRLLDCEAAAQRTRAFLRTLGHEMRNPLAPLRNASTIIQRTNDDPRADKAVEIILGQIEVLTRLADDLMEVSRLDARKVRLDLQRHDLRVLLRETHDAFRQSAHEKGLNLILMVPKGPLWVDVDRPKFHQAASNLVSNAIKYTPRGGKVWIKATQEGRDVLMRVEDTGLGISAELLPRLFELFSRGAAAEEAAPGGMGIGLSVVRELIDLHGGSVEARSSGAGKGSEFTVRLPGVDTQGQHIDG
ncbi:PAS domain-containing sensor histidine kinase [Ramlibacter henchirensis]|nr:PAS domain-containing sensor histidine kinase [Ramlibacter henchirensis]